MSRGGDRKTGDEAFAYMTPAAVLRWLVTGIRDQERVLLSPVVSTFRIWFGRCRGPDRFRDGLFYAD